MPVPMYTRPEIDQRLRDTNARIDNEGRYYVKLAKRVAELEKRYVNERYPQEYAAAPVVETRMIVGEEELAAAADLFVRTIGTGNRFYLKAALGRRGPYGDAVKALRSALDQHPTDRT